MVELEPVPEPLLLVPQGHGLRTVPLEQHSREHMVLMPERHRMVPWEHRLEHTQREQHSWEPSGHKLEHRRQPERHSSVSPYST